MRRYPMALLTLLSALTVSMPAAAQTERCVRNVAEFNSAWIVADDEPVLIKMAVGTYDLTGSVVDVDGAAYINVDDDVTIQGGYNSSCTARSGLPGDTVLTSSSRLLFTTFASIAEGSGSLTVDRLSFRNMPRIEFLTDSTDTPDQLLTLSRVWLDGVGQTVVNASEVALDNLLVVRGGNCALQIDRNRVADRALLDRFVMRHSTIANNSGAALCIGLADLSGNDWSATLTSNVFWNNSGDDIVLLNSGVNQIRATLLHNTYLNLQSNRGLASTPVATSSSNPQFVNAAAGNWRLSGASPAINSGRIDVNQLSQVDFDGEPRWFGDAPDRGAFESAVGSTATVLTVTNSNDAGPGSLRQALLDANAAPNINRIRFAIGTSCGPRIINLVSLLPDILQPVSIEGFTQPGAVRNTAVAGYNGTLCIAINGQNQITGAFGLNVNTSASPDATVSIEGIAFGGHSIAAVQFAGGRNHQLVGAQIGGSIGAVNLLPSNIGVRVASNTQSVRIGSSQPGDRNRIADTLSTGILVSGSGSTQPRLAIIENNYVGSLSGGDARGGNAGGILLRGVGHLVRGNVVHSNAGSGIELEGGVTTDNRITDNRIGVPALCFGTCLNRGNGGHGILVRNSANANRIEANLIAYSGLDAITIAAARENTIRRNSSFDNGGIAIDLGDDGRNYTNTNNSQAAPSGAGNDAQNYPSLSDARGSVGAGRASGSLTSANGWYRIDLYGAPSCANVVIGGIPLGQHGEARDWLGSGVVQISNGTASSDGTANFSNLPIAREGNPSYFSDSTRIISTATRLTGNPVTGLSSSLGTSELSRCRTYSVEFVEELFANGFEG